MLICYMYKNCYTTVGTFCFRAWFICYTNDVTYIFCRASCLHSISAVLIRSEEQTGKGVS